MNIWEAYCKPGYYNIYFDLFVAKGMPREEVENMKQLFNAYKQRINESCFKQELKAINSPSEFLNRLKEIFEVKWKNHIKYTEVAELFYGYLKFLDSMQALHNDFINNEERKRLCGVNCFNTGSLTCYETEYMVDGKLVALMNPTLLTMLRERINEDNLSTKRAPSICKNFYEGLIDMSIGEYAELINIFWDKTRRIKKGGKHNKIKITFPDGEEKELTTLCALTEIVNFYGFNAVLDKNLQIRNEKFLVKYVNVGKEKIYDSFGERMYINNQGDSKDRIHMARTINRMFGDKLQIELI